MTKLIGESAKIYQFPAGGRANLGKYRDALRFAPQYAMAGVVKIESSTGWYHEAAMLDTDQARKR